MPWRTLLSELETGNEARLFWRRDSSIHITRSALFALLLYTVDYTCVRENYLMLIIIIAVSSAILERENSDVREILCFQITKKNIAMNDYFMN